MPTAIDISGNNIEGKSASPTNPNKGHARNCKTNNADSVKDVLTAD